MKTVNDLAVALASKHGEIAGIKALGYPTSWCVTRQELDTIKQYIQEKRDAHESR